METEIKNLQNQANLNKEQHSADTKAKEETKTEESQDNKEENNNEEN